MISKCNDDELARHLWILRAVTESLAGSLTVEGAVRPREIVEPLPVSQLSVKVYVTGIRPHRKWFLPTKRCRKRIGMSQELSRRSFPNSSPT
jgi:hypothetical protein